VGASSTVTQRTGYLAGALTIPSNIGGETFGTVTRNVGFAVADFSGAGLAVNNTDILLGAGNSAVGNWSIYQSGTFPVRWRSGHIRKFVQLTPAQNYTILITDEVIILSDNAANNYTGTCTLPSVADMSVAPYAASAASFDGLTFTIKNMANGNAAAIVAGAGTTIPGSAVILGASQRTFTFKQSTNQWL
jgi:hypothetical protein